jgi:hypothetical protein
VAAVPIASQTRIKKKLKPEDRKGLESGGEQI